MVETLDDVDDLAMAMAMGTVGRLVRLDGELLPCRDDFFRVYSWEFAFPEYFDWNWPAFAECMTEVPELPVGAYLTVIERSDRLLRDEPVELPTLMQHPEFVGKQ